jgi:hypothetical protein
MHRSQLPLRHADFTAAGVLSVPVECSCDTIYSGAIPHAPMSRFQMTNFTISVTVQLGHLPPAPPAHPPTMLPAQPCKSVTAHANLGTSVAPVRGCLCTPLHTWCLHLLDAQLRHNAMLAQDELLWSKATWSAFKLRFPLQRIASDPPDVLALVSRYQTYRLCGWPAQVTAVHTRIHEHLRTLLVLLIAGRGAQWRL